MSMASPIDKLCPDAASPLYAAKPMYVPGDGLLCPDQQWLDDLAPALFRARGRSAGDLHIVNAGANKGFTAALLLQRFGGVAANFSNGDWYEALTRYLKERRLPATMHVCGVCCACREPRPLPAGSGQHTHEQGARVRLHAFEPLKVNYDFLALAFPQFSTPRTLATIVRAALGSQRNRTAAIAEHKGILVGKENAPARLMDAGAPPGQDFASVPITVLDDWMQQQSIPHVDLALFDVSLEQART